MPEDKPAILHTESSCGWGGQEIRILEETCALKARGLRVELACPPESELFQRAPQWGVEPIALPIARRSVSGLLAVRKLLQSRRHDIVNTHSSTDSWLVATACRTALCRPKVVRTRHISALVSRSITSRWLYRHGCDHVVTTGEALRRMVTARTGLDDRRITSIPTGIDPNRFCPSEPSAARHVLGLPPQRPLIGIVATIRSWKGHLYLLDAVAHARLADWGVVIVGDGPYAYAVRRRVNELRLGERVRLVGQQPNPQTWLQACEIVCQPSYANEGVSQSVLQAMMTGRPVISTPVGATEEAVRHGQTGIIVPVRDAPAIASALERLADDPAFRQALGSHAREIALREFSLDTMADRMEAVFDLVLGRSPSTR